MAASGAKIGYGTTLTIDGTLVGEINKIGGVSLTQGEAKVTHLGSDSGYEEFKPTMRDGGTLSLEGNLIVADVGQIALLTGFNAGTIHTVIITLPTATGSTWTFTAFSKGLKLPGDFTNEGMVFSVEFRITGKPTFATAASVNVTALTVTTGTLVPTFAAATYSYVAHVATDQATVTMTATFAAGVATLTYGTSSQTLTTVTPSSAITLGAAGSLTVVTIVVQETAKTPKTYVITVERA